MVYILHYDNYDPAIDASYFINTVFGWSAHYWASEKSAWTTDNWRWEIYPANGMIGVGSGSKPNYARAVRGIVKNNCFVDNGDGTVTDKSTGLMWQQGSGDTMNWEEALSYCEDLNLADYTDWRLPNMKELISIVDYQTSSPAINVECFTISEANSSRYWSSTTNSHWPSNAWKISFSNGMSEFSKKTDNGNVRAVREGS